jgi:hypothetical protein
MSAIPLVSMTEVINVYKRLEQHHTGHDDEKLVKDTVLQDCCPPVLSANKTYGSPDSRVKIVTCLQISDILKGHFHKKSGFI